MAYDPMRRIYPNIGLSDEDVMEMGYEHAAAVMRAEKLADWCKRPWWQRWLFRRPL